MQRQNEGDARMTRYLVTGGTGFLGRHVVRRLREEGNPVQVLTRDAGHTRDVSDGVELVEGDVRDLESMRATTSGVDRVVHLASDFRDLTSDWENSYEVNVRGTLNVLTAAAEAGAGRVVHCSTVGVVGSVSDPPADEETPLDPADIPYEVNKAKSEEEAWKFSEEHSLPVVVVRPAGIYGPGDLRLLKLFQMVRDGKFFMVGSGEALIDMVYVEDVADGIARASRNEDAVGETFFLSGEQYMPVDDFVRLVAEALDVSPPRLRLPLLPMKAMAVVLETLFAPFDATPPLTRRRLGFYTNNRAYSSEKARRMLGYEPAVSVEEGLRRTVDWYRSEGHL